MLAYTIRRLLIGLVTLVLISIVVYGLIRAMPGDPATLELVGGEAADVNVTATQLAEMRAAFGLDRHWTIAYAEWMARILRGDLGTSLRQRTPVAGLILDALGPTLLLSVTSILLAYALSIPLGLYAAHRSGKPDERALTALLYILYSFPSYVVAIFLLLYFSVKLGWLPVFGMRGSDYEELSMAGQVWDLAQHMVLPVTCYTYGALAYSTRFIRSNIAEVYRQDYIRTARAKGLRESTVLVKHAFRSSLIPFVTMIGLSFPALLSGSVILERIFAWPGMGRLFFDALLYRDYPVIMGLAMMFSVLVLAGTLLADLLYAVVDPRISYS
jgi:peptide/nickel transport system permease protein